MKKGGYKTLYLENMAEVLRKLFNFGGKGDTVLSLERGDASSRAASLRVTTENTRTGYEEMNRDVMRSRNSSNEWTENCDGNTKSFMGLIQVSSDKLVAVLTRKTLVPNPADVILVSVSAGRKLCMIHNIRTLAGFVPVVSTQEQLEEVGTRENEEILVYRLTLPMKMPLEKCVRDTADLVGREGRMRAICRSTNVIVRHLQNYELEELTVKTTELVGC